MLVTFRWRSGSPFCGGSPETRAATPARRCRGARVAEVCELDRYARVHRTLLDALEIQPELQRTSK
jgi:hypothetical protein